MCRLYHLASRAILLSLALTAWSKTDPVTTKSLVTTDGYTYVYDHVYPHNDSMPTFLLLHGYPASRYYWYPQVRALTEAGFGVIAPDSLGYGDSSKPTPVEAYNLKDMADHTAQILDAEGVQNVIGVGHDWGSGVLSRCAVFQRQRFSKLVFMSAGYAAPGLFFDVDKINWQGLNDLGYTPFGYWYFYNSYDSAGIISQNLESYFHLLYHTNSSAWGENMAQLTAARGWLTANKTTELPPWLTADDKANWLQTYSQPDTVVATLNYYKALMRGVQEKYEASLTDEDRELKVPVLGIGGSADAITLSDVLGQNTKPWAKVGYEERIVEAGHWIMLEKPGEINQILIDFASPTKENV